MNKCEWTNVVYCFHLQFVFLAASSKARYYPNDARCDPSKIALIKFNDTEVAKIFQPHGTDLYGKTENLYVLHGRGMELINK